MQHNVLPHFDSSSPWGGGYASLLRTVDTGGGGALRESSAEDSPHSPHTPRRGGNGAHSRNTSDRGDEERWGDFAASRELHRVASMLTKPLAEGGCPWTATMDAKGGFI